MIDEQGKYIELQDYIKLVGLTQTGGQSKILIRAGKVLVDGKIEIKLRRKLRHGMKVEYEDKQFVVDGAKIF